jgi:hypothetical protein
MVEETIMIILVAAMLPAIDDSNLCGDIEKTVW